jgi:hypothetical protein
MFGADPQITITSEKQTPRPCVTLATDNAEKAAALLKLLPETVAYGNVTLDVKVECPTAVDLAFANAKQLFETAFAGNPVFAYTVVPEDCWYPNFTYVVFKNCVVQFFNDNLNDPHGIVSTLYQTIADEIFVKEGLLASGVAYCTDIESKVGVPLGEWP